MRNSELSEAGVGARCGDLACKFRFAQDLIGFLLVIGDSLSSYQEDSNLSSWFDVGILGLGWIV